MPHKVVSYVISSYHRLNPGEISSLYLLCDTGYTDDINSLIDSHFPKKDAMQRIQHEVVVDGGIHECVQNGSCISCV